VNDYLETKTVVIDYAEAPPPDPFAD
jgi:hypothetical protein